MAVSGERNHAPIESNKADFSRSPWRSPRFRSLLHGCARSIAMSHQRTDGIERLPRKHRSEMPRLPIGFTPSRTGTNAKAARIGVRFIQDVSRFHLDSSNLRRTYPER